MRRVFMPFLVGLFLLFSAAAWAQQGSSETLPAASLPPATQNGIAGGTPNCSAALEALRSAQQAMDRNRRPFYFASDSENANAAASGNPSQENLRQDLISLDQKTAEYTACLASNNFDEAAQDPPAGCTSESLLNFPVSHRGEPGGRSSHLASPGESSVFLRVGNDDRCRWRSERLSSGQHRPLMTSGTRALPAIGKASLKIAMASHTSRDPDDPFSRLLRFGNGIG